MAIAEVGAGTGVTGAYGTGYTLTKPGTLASTDVVVMSIRCSKTVDPLWACSGFTQTYWEFNNANGTSNLAILIGTGASIAGGGSFTVTSGTLASGDFAGLCCAAWSGVDSAGFVYGTAYDAGPGGAAFVIPAVTTTSDNALVLAVGAQTFVGGARTFTPAYTDEANSDGAFIASRAQATAGSTGTVSVANSSFTSAVALLLAMHESTATTPVAVLGRHTPGTTNYRNVRF